jgi:hypothetical protein
MVAAVRIHTPAGDGPLGAMEVLAVFDHDWEAHVLVQEWDRLATEPRWVYSLWFVDSAGARRVHEFDAPWPRVPFAAAAEVVERWRFGAKGTGMA